jgi:glyoxylase-like metal-dependent hydrolase (beta-lactamase superfamily II)
MTVAVTFDREFTCDYGVALEVAPGLRRIVANNPSAYTFKGTNTYIVGAGEVAVIDPGPDDVYHRGALLEALAEGGERVTHILLTHTHKDHSAGLANLARETGAMVLGYGAHISDPHTAALTDGSPHLDADFIPDRALRHGDRVLGGGWELEAIHTPGHAPDHLCYALHGAGAGVILTGDHVMGWNTSVIAPPDGNLSAYLRSLELLTKRDEETYFPAHGASIAQGRRLAGVFIMHRRWREQQIVTALREGCDTIGTIVPRIYQHLTMDLVVAASYSVLAHLEMLNQNGSVCCQGRPDLHSRYWLPDAPAPL